MVKVKICGITNYEDAALAVDLGVDALGFIFAPSPRRITPEKARKIIAALPPLVTIIGVFVDEDERHLLTIADYCGLQVFQFHGNESPEFCGKFKPRAIKSFRLKESSDLSSLSAYRDQVRAFHLDTFQTGLFGGTGRTFPWHLAKEAKAYSLPLILSGGLTHLNIRQAIRDVHPYAVDVSSGIEVRPGKKDAELMRQLVEIIKGVNPND
jgi:phosphoribosylanthranilate isomerase